MIKGRQVAEEAEPVESDHPEAHEDEAEAREGGEEAEYRDQDRRVLHREVPFRLMPGRGVGRWW